MFGDVVVCSVFVVYVVCVSNLCYTLKIDETVEIGVDDGVEIGRTNGATSMLSSCPFEHLESIIDFFEEMKNQKKDG
ncbi:hypothetical protein B9Z55_001820 [Caenorhabditis nigoni]|uniref:Uncharacterized protein n=1 Tax=Caenorhabditis nigoni TaxID=1611254 RepID=A0A2G5VHJ4_9PELO|nr:hypothetical protein B9Z55_001820 [Caenorhabditis nigoni]